MVNKRSIVEIIINDMPIPYKSAKTPIDKASIDVTMVLKKDCAEITEVRLS